MVQNQKSDRKLILFTVLLLLLEISGLLMHLQILPNPFKHQVHRIESKPAGFVAKSQRELRKREFNSLVWENASTDDVVYYYDSVLTLSQSSATLNLNEQTEVHLSENTLVTIEPPESNEDSQIRLKFTRGDLRARNPYASAKIETNEWSLNLNQGSEVSLRQTGKDDYEVEVLKGKLEFEKENGKESLAENQVLKIEDNKPLQTLAVSENLKFVGPDYQRIYSFQPEAHIPIQWKGKANEIQISPLGKDKVLKTVSAEKNSEDLALTPGKYTLRLLQGEKVSEAKEIEIWQAPSLHLLSPFPRDRVRTHENISFVWTFLPEAKEYRFIVTDLKTGKVTEQRVSTNSQDYSFLDESDATWKVIGIDKDGFEIPSMYANPIFPRNEPLAAPKLKNPLLRVPASKNTKPHDSSFGPRRSPFWAVLTRLWIQQARADEKKTADYEAVFAWEPVEGADYYTIEISDTSDFQSPKVSKLVRRTHFIWTQFSLGTYYWRVAAGSNKGRLGVFSEPAKVSLEKLPENSSDSDGVLIRKKSKPLVAEKHREPVETKTEEIFKNVPASTFEEKRFEQKAELVSEDQRNLKQTYLLEWTPHFALWNLNGQDELKAKLSGTSLGGLHFQTEQLLSSDKSYLVDLTYAQYKWKATDTITYPFQEDQSYTDARVQVLLGNNKSGFHRGGILQTVPTLKRKDLEKVEIKPTLAIGPSGQWIYPLSPSWSNSHTVSLTAGSSLVALSFQSRFRYSFFKSEQSAASLGFHFQGDFIFDQSRFSNNWAAGLSLGFEH